MFSVDTDRITRLELELMRASEKAIPFATRNTLNSAAFSARSHGQENIREKMITRNKFTVNSVGVEKTNATAISQQRAVVGSVADYMDEQEFGAIRAKKGKHGVPIPTAVTSGEGEGVQPRRRVPRRSNRLANLTLQQRRRIARNNKQELLFKVQDAVTSGDRLFFHEFNGRTKGIFRVRGGSRRFKRGWPVGAELKMLYDLSRPSVRIPATPWLGPAVEKTKREIPRLYVKSLNFQLRRLRK